jgi:hypothetical protein
VASIIDITETVRMIASPQDPTTAGRLSQCLGRKVLDPCGF